MADKTKESELIVQWLNEQETNSIVNETSIPETRQKVEYDPFKKLEQEESVKDSHETVLEAYDEGLVDLNEAITALDKSYRVNHSVAQGILDDKRLKPVTRIKRYVEWAVSEGQDPMEAAEFAFRTIAKQKRIAGNWGTMQKELGINLDDMKQRLEEKRRNK